jgi:hypothetical protein
VPVVALCTVAVIVQLPLAGMLALLNAVLVVVDVNAIVAPVQVVAASGAAGWPDVLMVRPLGNVVLKFDCVSAKPLVLASVIVSVEVAFGATVAGENDSVIVGAAGSTAKLAGQAVAALPDAEGGAELVAIPFVKLTVSISVLPAESVIVSVKFPVPPVTVTLELFAPLLIRPAGLLDQAYEAMLSGAAGTALELQPGRLALASRMLPAETVAGITMTPIGACAALTALSALTMPAPHWPEFRQEHSPLFGSFAGHTGSGGFAPFAGNAVALALRRVTS